MTRLFRPSPHEVVSGLKINLRKCKIIPVEEVGDIDSPTQVFNCWVGALPTTYLGLLLGASNKNVTTMWNPVIERVEKRLAAWQKRYLSKGGKEVLIKSTLSKIPTYYISLFHAPASILGKLEKILRDFRWDMADGIKKFIW